MDTQGGSYIYIYISKGPAARTATVPLGAGTAGHSTRFCCKRPVSCGIPAGIPAGISAQQCEAGVLVLLFYWLPELGPNGQGEVLGIFF